MEYIPKGFEPNLPRANSIFAYLISTYKDGDFPYTKDAMARLPQDHVPPELWSNANFWFYLTHMMRGMIESHTSASQVVRLYRIRPDLFDPTQAVKLTEAEIHEQLERVFGTLPRRQNFSLAWHRNSHLLLAWDGDIRNVYEGVTTEEMVRARITNKLKYTLPPREQGFFGFQEKMCSLLTYFLMVAGHIPRIRMSPPMDFHHQRVMVSTGIIPLTKGRYSPKAVVRLADQVGRYYLDRFSGMDPIKFADLLFVLSREACTKAVTGPEVDWDDPKIIKRHADSCKRCPVEHKCTMTVLPKSYYPSGDKKPRVIHVVPRPRAPRRLREP